MAWLMLKSLYVARILGVIVSDQLAVVFVRQIGSL